MMTSPSKRRPMNHPSEHGLPQSDSSKARLFLFVACLWPLFILALFASSAPHVDPNNSNSLLRIPSSSDVMAAAERGSFTVYGDKVLSVKNILDRVDILGYGPTHPRVAVVLVGNDKENLVTSLESVFQHTDLNRVFVVVVVVDGRDEDASLVRDLKKIDSGSIPHWHGKRPDLHNTAVGEAKEDEDEDPHGKKVHVIFNPEARGMAESRADAVDFISILKQQHEDAGMKSTEEDLILLLLESGASLTSTKWLNMVTDALIVPPPIIAEHEYTIALKIANAVSFNLEGSGKRSSFDTTFTPVISYPTADQINESNGASYPTPAFNGAAIAMRHETYMNLPSQDPSLTDAWPANLDLALNLWLCGDGIDMLQDLTVTSFQQPPRAPLEPELAARFAAAWMDEITSKKFFNVYTKIYSEVTYYDWEKLMSQAKQSNTFSRDLSKRCRSFQWFVENVNPEFGDLLLQSAEVPKAEPPAPAPTQAEEVEEEQRKAEQDGGEDVFEIPDRPDDKKKPSKPLCNECLEIIQKAELITLEYVDVSAGHKEHPHLGATDEEGKLGYVLDETALRQHPPAFDYPDDKLRAACLKRDNNYKMLTEKVYVDLKSNEEIIKSGKPRDKLFCMVYTIDSGHPKIPLIRETWGPKCDGFIVASNKTEIAIGAVNIPHEGEEDYHNIWQKVRSMWSYVYDNYYEKYDWFHIGGDDLYLIVENLRLYLESEEIQTAANGGLYLPDGTEKTQVPLFLGRRFAYQGNMDDIFNSGGSGYTMNKAALKTLVAKGIPQYFPHAHTFSEDTMVAHIFAKFGVYPYETKDENGGERYMPFLPGHHYGYRIPADHESDWYAKYSINIKEGADHCAAKSVAFHYVKGDMMKRLHALLYGLCPPDTLK